MPRGSQPGGLRGRLCWGPHPFALVTSLQASGAAPGRAAPEAVQAEAGAGSGERASFPHPEEGAVFSQQQVHRVGNFLLMPEAKQGYLAPTPESTAFAEHPPRPSDGPAGRAQDSGVHFQVLLLPRCDFAEVTFPCCPRLPHLHSSANQAKPPS